MVVPGKSTASLLWEIVEAYDMPHERDPLSVDAKKLLRKWIDDGAVWAGEEIDPLAFTPFPREPRHSEPQGHA